MYRITADAKKGVVLVCTHCTYEISVEDFDRFKGNPRTQAATKMWEHLSHHGRTLLQTKPEDVKQRSWQK